MCFFDFATYERLSRRVEKLNLENLKRHRNGLAEAQKKLRNGTKRLHFEGQSFDQGGSPMLFCFENGKYDPPLTKIRPRKGRVAQLGRSKLLEAAWLLQSKLPDILNRKVKPLAARL